MITINTSSGVSQDILKRLEEITSSLDKEVGDTGIEIKVLNDLSFKVQYPRGVTTETRDVIEDRLEGSMKDLFNLSPRLFPEDIDAM